MARVTKLTTECYQILRHHGSCAVQDVEAIEIQGEGIVQVVMYLQTHMPVLETGWQQDEGM